MRALLIGLAILLLVPCRGLAQSAATSPTPASPTPASPAPASTASALTPAQARAALDVLNDPKKRAEVTATLEAIAKARPTPAQPAATSTPAEPAASSAPAAAPATPPAGKTATEGLSIPLAPNSLGAQVLVGAADFLNRIASGATNGLHAMQSLPLLWGWVVIMATNPWARDILLDVAWRLAVALLCGLAIEFTLRLAMRRPIAVLEAQAPAGGPPAALQDAEGDAASETQADPDSEPPETPGHVGREKPWPERGEAPEHADGAGPGPMGGAPPGHPAGDEQRDPAGDERRDAGGDAQLVAWPAPDDAVARAEAGDIEPPIRRRRGLPAIVLLRRVPLVLARLVLDLIPVLGLVVVGHLVAGSAIGGSQSSRLVLLAVVDAYAVCAALLSVARMLLSPGASRLRLFYLPDTLAAYLMRWTRRLICIAVFGYAIGEVGLLLGLSDVAHDGLQKATGFVLHACLAVIVLQKRRAVRRWLRAPPGAAGATARVRNALASVWHWIALFFIVAIWLVWAVEIPDGFTRLLHFFFVTALLLIGVRLALILLEGSLDRALSVPPETAARYPGLEARLRLYHPAVSALLRAVLYVLCVLALLQLYGFGAFTWFSQSELGHRVVSALGTLAVTLLLALAAWEAANAAIQHHLAKLAKNQQLARSARLRTLLPLMRSALLIAILVVTGMMVLSEIGINIAPLLAGAGIIGVAIGFGSQKLVQDLITGIFLLLENAMQVGDTVTVSGLTGTVEALSVRTIRLRAGDGSVSIIPFSAVTTVNNVNRGLGNAAVNVTIDYQEDTDRVAAVLAEIVSGMRADPDFAGKMLGDLQLWGVDKVDGAGATMVGQMVCTDSGRWSVQREFNRRMKQRFQELGIRLYNPMRNVAVTLPPAPASAGTQVEQHAEGPQAAEPPAGQTPAGQTPAGQPPAGQPQAGQPQAGQPQAGQPQAGQPQAGQLQAGPSPGTAEKERAHEQSRAAD